MLRLLLIQYFDVTQEDIEYMATDRPDPRRQAGTLAHHDISQETLQGIADRVGHYRNLMRRRRERTWLQVQCLRKQIARTEALCKLAEELLVSRFGMAAEMVKNLKARARTAVPKPEIRELEARWERNEVTEEEYQKRRLSIEYQALVRRLDRERRRLELATREYDVACKAPLQDHEVGHIWGIPAGTLAARKIKHLQQYLQGLQAQLQKTVAPGDQAALAPLDLWKETFAVLANRPVERSAATYDGLEGSEAALIDKLTAFAMGTLPEEIESRFWLTITQEVNPLTEYGDRLRSLFALQRLNAILTEMDTSPETLEQELLARVSPRPKALPVQAPEDLIPAEPQPLGEMAEHVIRSFIGEDRGGH